MQALSELPIAVSIQIQRLASGLRSPGVLQHPPVDALEQVARLGWGDGHHAISRKNLNQLAASCHGTRAHPTEWGSSRPSMSQRRDRCLQCRRVDHASELRPQTRSRSPRPGSTEPGVTPSPGPPSLVRSLFVAPRHPSARGGMTVAIGAAKSAKCRIAAPWPRPGAAACSRTILSVSRPASPSLSEKHPLEAAYINVINHECEIQKASGYSMRHHGHLRPSCCQRSICGLHLHRNTVGDGIATSEFALDSAEDAALLTGDEGATRVGGVVAAIR